MPAGGFICLFMDLGWVAARMAFGDAKCLHLWQSTKGTNLVLQVQYLEGKRSSLLQLLWVRVESFGNSQVNVAGFGSWVRRWHIELVDDRNK